jgi:hypothetical protein
LIGPIGSAILFFGVRDTEEKNMLEQLDLNNAGYNPENLTENHISHKYELPERMNWKNAVEFVATKGLHDLYEAMEYDNSWIEVRLGPPDSEMMDVWAKVFISACAN